MPYTLYPQDIDTLAVGKCAIANGTTTANVPTQLYSMDAVYFCFGNGPQGIVFQIGSSLTTFMIRAHKGTNWGGWKEL